MITNWIEIGFEGEVLIVEDDETLRLIMVEILEDVGARTVAFGSADDALIYLLQSQVQCCLVIVDYGVPGQINGMDFIRMVRGKWPAIGSILTSGYPFLPETVPRPTRYLQKPWAVSDLVALMRDLLQPTSLAR
ncbi:response regulator [Pseudomonas sp. FP198]|uniref:response regulator n=1 Tax=Pseudomonas sp. FP198 TaxID=2954084 RepID=UPI0027369A5A|nr:response regulator [Pseudomonas sp. FP198]WLG93841.1 response regulator [Pseudomonas sp. FP198]